jgi:uncharacterized protein
MSSAPTWAHRTDEGWVLSIRAQPGARRSEVAGAYGDALRIRIGAPANDNKANAELVRFLATSLGVPRRSVTIARGHTSRDKAVEVASADIDLDRLESP